VTDALAPVETVPCPELERLQVDRLRALVARAARVPLYRERLREAGVQPEDGRRLDARRRLPFTTKGDSRDA
jgi:phenylacetate-CoA ligase